MRRDVARRAVERQQVALEISTPEKPAAAIASSFSASPPLSDTVAIEVCIARCSLRAQTSPIPAAVPLELAAAAHISTAAWRPAAVGVAGASIKKAIMLWRTGQNIEDGALTPSSFQSDRCRSRRVRSGVERLRLRRTVSIAVARDDFGLQMSALAAFIGAEVGVLSFGDALKPDKPRRLGTEFAGCGHARAASAWAWAAGRGFWAAVSCRHCAHEPALLTSPKIKIYCLKSITYIASMAGSAGNAPTMEQNLFGEIE